MKKQENKLFEIKSIDYNVENEELIIKGYASIFGNEDSLQITWNPELGDYVKATDIVEKGAFKKTLSERKNRIAFCVNHELEEPVGKILVLKEDQTGLYFESRISDAENELKTKIREEIYSEMSFGFQVMKATFEKKKDGTYIRRITEIKLFEISIVTIARNEKARITEFKSEEYNNIIDSLLLNEEDKEKKDKLMQLKSLFIHEPNDSLDNKEPIKDIIDFNKLQFN